jgi:lysozyme family protein
MNENFDKSLGLVLQSEGLYVNDPHDAGGETMRGVTRNAWAGWLKRPIADGEMAKLTVEDVTPFYKALYWDKARCSELPLGVDYCVFDASVNAGVGGGIKLLQKAIGCVPDGSIGPNTMKAIQEADAKGIIEKFATAKEEFYHEIVEHKPDQVKYLNGWLDRVKRVKTTALGMINGN